MSKQTAEELKQERIAKMGEHLGVLYDSLYNEVIWIKHKWIEYRELYGTNETRIELMNYSAPWLFFIIQKVLFEDILLGLSKITDPPGTGKDETTTLRVIPQFIHDANLKNNVQRCLTTIISHTDFCRDWRNRVIAHKDRKLTLDDPNSKPLQTANRLKVQDAITSIENLINVIEQHYFNSQTAFHFLDSDRGALSLLELLNDGVKFRAERDKALKEIEDSL
jgi:hypothetical protein